MDWLALEHKDEPEQIDDPDEPLSALQASMWDLARTNALFGGVHAIIQGVSAILGNILPGSTVNILDIATGSADIPIALVRWGAERGIRMRITALDNQDTMLVLARSRVIETVQTKRDFPSLPDKLSREISFHQGDARSIPFADGAFDIVTCALALHHLGFADAVTVLREMDRLSRRGFVATDLRRDKLTLLTVHIGVGLIRAHPITRHDSAASVRRSFSSEEWHALKEASGLSNVCVDSHLYYRLRMIQRKGR